MGRSRALELLLKEIVNAPAREKCMDTREIAVIGAGSWGTALAKLLSDKGHQVMLWGHRPEHVAAIQSAGENRSYLPGFILGGNLGVTADLRLAVTGKQVVVMVVPSHGYRQVFVELVPALRNDAVIVSATKGIENETLLTMTQVMNEVLAGRRARLAVLSGPSFAREVAAGLPTAVTVASEDREAVSLLQQIFHTERFRVYASTDVVGLELGGALKNIVAIAAGICDGLGYGTNTRAALITRGLAEIARLGVKMGANPLTFAGLAGLGDLVLTCTGDLSRNRQVGLKLGQGKTLSEILAEMQMVAEGVKTTRSAWNLARREGVEMPILEQIYQVLYEDKPCREAVQALLMREQKEELE
jgi:glycerol-3-phosphate dehydrogenase (NAD(P)+)